MMMASTMARGMAVFGLALAALGCAGGEAVDAPAVGERPHSLRGTEVDGRLTVDPKGRFLVSADAVRLFDYFLTTEGEVDDEARRLLVATEARLRLPGEAAREAMAFYDAYVDYRRRFDAAIEKAGPEADEAELLARVRRARAETVGEHALFAEDDALVAQAIAAKRAMAAGDMGEVARRMQVAAWFAPRSAADAEAERAARRPLALRHREATARAQGADAAQIEALRVAEVGAEAAARLARLDAERAAWQARVDEAAAVVAALDAGDPGFAAAREAALAARFAGAELRRARAVVGAY